MKKAEALQLAPQRSTLICEYITQILSDTEKVNGEIKIDSAKINNERMITFDIYVPNSNFERHFNAGITTQQINVLTEQILNDLIAKFLESESIFLTKYYIIRGGYGVNMDGVILFNDIGSIIKLNFACQGNKFDEQIRNYNEKLDEYDKRQADNIKSK